MWWTPCGERYLTGTEATLLKRSIAFIHAQLDCELAGDTGHRSYGVPVFDRLNPAQKVAILTQVAEALLLPDSPLIEFTALTEGTAAAIYENIGDMIQSEIEAGKFNEPVYTWRMLVLAAHVETSDAEEMREGNATGEDIDEEDDYELPAPDCTDGDEWGILLECLDGCVFWDNDYLEDRLPNVHLLQPGAKRNGKDQAGEIPYFNQTIPTPSEDELSALHERLHALRA